MQLIDCNNLSKSQKFKLIKKMQKYLTQDDYIICGKVAKQKLNNNVKNLFIDYGIHEWNKNEETIKPKLIIPNSVRTIFMHFHYPQLLLNYVYPKSVKFIYYNCFESMFELTRKYYCCCCKKYILMRECVRVKNKIVHVKKDYKYGYFDFNKVDCPIYHIQHVICKKCIE